VITIKVSYLLDYRLWISLSIYPNPCRIGNILEVPGAWVSFNLHDMFLIKFIDFSPISVGHGS
jgi:hypothetical protein